MFADRITFALFWFIVDCCVDLLIDLLAVLIFVLTWLFVFDSAVVYCFGFIWLLVVCFGFWWVWFEFVMYMLCVLASCGLYLRVLCELIV